MDDPMKMYETGELAPYGNYACAGPNCYETDGEPQVCFITEDEGELPECPICGMTKWVKF